MTKPNTAKDLRDRMVEHGITLAGSAFIAYCERAGDKSEEIAPIIQLPVSRFVVVDVDSDQGLGEFHRLLAAGEMKHLRAYVLTDKGVLLVYDEAGAQTCEIPGDVRYERISRKRGTYDMRCLSKRDGKPHQMVAVRRAEPLVVVSGPMGVSAASGAAVEGARGYIAQDVKRLSSPWERLAELWTELAQAAAGLGIWADALKPSGEV